MCQWERFQKCVRTIKKIIMKNTHKKTFLNMQNVPSREDFKSVPDVPGLSIPYYSGHLQINTRELLQK